MEGGQFAVSGTPTLLHCSHESGVPPLASPNPTGFSKLRPTCFYMWQGDAWSADAFILIIQILAKICRQVWTELRGLSFYLVVFDLSSSLFCHLLPSSRLGQSCQPIDTWKWRGVFYVGKLRLWQALQRQQASPSEVSTGILTSENLSGSKSASWITLCPRLILKTEQLPTFITTSCHPQRNSQVVPVATLSRCEKMPSLLSAESAD